MSNNQEIKNFLNYSKDCTKSFKILPLNQIDFAIFSKISYFKFEKILNKRKKSIKIRDLTDDQISNILILPIASHRDLDIDLMKSIRDNPRFKDIEIKNSVNFFNEENDEQFYAMTLKIKAKGTKYILCYRGTDSTMTGWKEDFNMSFMKETPSQKDATDYLNKFLKMNFKKVYLCGHSKGGNLSEFAFINCKKRYKKRIIKTFSFDGPGINTNRNQRVSYNTLYNNKIVKFIPEQSIFGMLFDTAEQCNIVNATGKALEQHNLYNWIIDDKKHVFLMTKSLNKKFNEINEALYKWTTNVPRLENEKFINLLFKIIKNAGFTLSIEITSNKKEAMSKIKKEFSKLSSEDRKFVMTTLKPVLKILAKSII